MHKKNYFISICLEIQTKTRFFLKYFIRQVIYSPKQTNLFKNILEPVKDWFKEITLSIDNSFNKNDDSAKAKANKTNLLINISNIDDNVFFIHANRKIFNFVKKTIQSIQSLKYNIKCFSIQIAII